MAEVQAVPRLKTRRRLMRSCGTYFPHLAAEVGKPMSEAPILSAPERGDERETEER